MTVFDELRVPVVVAPMAGGPTTPALVAGAVRGGGSGFLAGGYLTGDALAGAVAETRDLGVDRFGVNLFVPGADSPADIGQHRGRVSAEAGRLGVEPGEPRWDDDNYADTVDVVVAARVPFVSFTFGLPRPADVDRLHEVGSRVIATVTTPDEADEAVAAGADALCVQGGAAGGHRGTFRDDPTFAWGGEVFDLLPALRLIRARTDVPLVAAGGLIHGADVAAVLAAGAVAAQLGTAFLLCPEAGTNATYRAALAGGGRETALTRAFSGRPARGLVNRFLAENTDAPSAYPQVHNMTKPVRAAAAQAGDPEVMSLWAGQGYPLVARGAPVADVLAELAAQAVEAIGGAARRLGANP